MTRAAMVARWTAVAIAVAGVIDPAVTSTRPVRADVAVIGDAATPLMAEVIHALDEDFSVIPGALPGVAATVLVGDALPDDARGVRGPAFVVAPDLSSRPRVVAVVAPQRASVHAAVRVEATLMVPAGSAAAEVALLYEGATVDRTSIASSDVTQRAVLSFVPLRTGPAVVSVVAQDADGARLDGRDVAIDVGDAPWRVLFHDRRPSWTSTFIRRAVENDPRFDVATRVRASPDVAVRLGAAPESLRADALGDFSVVVVGAPDALTAADVAAIEAFGRIRGGTVVLALAETPTGAVSRMVGSPRWQTTTAATPLVVLPSEAGLMPLAATEMVWPVALPAGGRPLATADEPAGGSPTVIWESPVGAGAVIVSGALDAWRFRAADSSGYEAFWRQVLAGAAARAVPPLDVRLTRTVFAPGERLSAEVVLRDIALQASGTGSLRASTSVSGDLRPAGDPDAPPIPVRLWPSGPAGQLRTEVELPEATGAYRLTVRGGSATGTAVIAIRPDARRPSDEGGVIAAWATSRGGRVVRADELGDLVRDIAGIAAMPERETEWHPMRSAWWIVPFSLALGVEWWWRRQRGLP